jgi:acetate kinase
MPDILCLNHGSSSLKYALYRPQREMETRVVGGVRQVADVASAVRRIREELNRAGHQVSAVGHRVVHGGPDLAAPQAVTPELISVLGGYVPFAPLHLPPQLELIRAALDDYPDVPHVACFDTSFHRRIPELAQRLPLPRSLWDEGIRRYGFHGLSFEFILMSLGGDAGRRLIIAHLGNGVSMAAVLQGVPVDTTMGLTPSGGMMMGTRSGDLDPGVLLYLMSRKNFDASRLQHVIDMESGLLGVSGLSGDMRVLLERRSTSPTASQAVEMFSYQARKCIGALAAALGGLDTLVFTGGIGEHAAAVRAEICSGLDHLGIAVDANRNSRDEAIISPADKPCVVRVIATNEELMIARHTRAVLQLG